MPGKHFTPAPFNPNLGYEQFCPECNEDEPVEMQLDKDGFWRCKCGMKIGASSEQKEWLGEFLSLQLLDDMLDEVLSQPYPPIEKFLIRKVFEDGSADLVFTLQNGKTQFFHMGYNMRKKFNIAHLKQGDIMLPKEGIIMANEKIDQKKIGVYPKFFIERLDGRDKAGGDRMGAKLFVLDITFDRHAIPALKAYTESCQEEYTLLAEDLKKAAEAAEKSGEEKK